MKTLVKCASFGFIVAGLAAQAAVNDANRYVGIGERNPFGLKPIQQAPVETSAPPAIPKVLLTGITDITGVKQAILTVQHPGTPGSPAKEEPGVPGCWTVK